MKHFCALHGVEMSTAGCYMCNNPTNIQWPQPQTEWPSPKGWQCPVCGKGNAPFISECNCHLSETRGGFHKTTHLANSEKE
jgi:hypothetical protein